MKTVFVTSNSFDRKTSIRLSEDEIRNLELCAKHEETRKSELLANWFDRYIKLDTKKNFTQIVRDRLNLHLLEMINDLQFELKNRKSENQKLLDEEFPDEELSKEVQLELKIRGTMG